MSVGIRFMATGVSLIAITASTFLTVSPGNAQQSTNGPKTLNQDSKSRHKQGTTELAKQKPGVDLGHQEGLDDPPAARRPKMKTTPGRLSSRGFMQSVQVNVNSAGQNIVGDAANEPSIAVDPTNPNRIAIGWRQFDTISSNFRQAGRAFSTDGGATWTNPGPFTPGNFRSDPVLGHDASGKFYYYSLQGSGSGWACDMFVSSDGGANWAGPIPAGGGDKAWMTVDRSRSVGSGNVYVAWSPFFSCCPGFFTRSTDGGATFMEAISLPVQLFWGQLAVGPAGELYICGTLNSGVPVCIKSKNASDAAATPSFSQVVPVNLGGVVEISEGPNPNGLLGQFSIYTDHSFGPNRGNVYMLCSVNPSNNDPLDVMFARSTDGGVTWSPPARINTDAAGPGHWQWFGALSVAPNGRLDVIWNDTRNDPQDLATELYYCCSTDGGLTWGPNTVISQPFDPFLGYPNQNKIGDYYDLVSSDTSVHIAYSATFNGEQDTYYLCLNVAEEIAAGAYKLDGRQNGGTLGDLAVSDGQTLDLEPKFTINLNKQRVDLILLGSLQTASPSQLSFTLESRMAGAMLAGDVIQDVRLYDFVDQLWKQIDSQPVQLDDTSLAIVPPGDPARYVRPGTNEVRTRVTWTSQNFLNEIFQWEIFVDQAVWVVKE